MTRGLYTELTGPFGNGGQPVNVRMGKRPVSIPTARARGQRWIVGVGIAVVRLVRRMQRAGKEQAC